MSEISIPVADIQEEAARILDAAEADGFPLRLLGGLAIYFQCPSIQSDTRLQRAYKDFDFVTLGKWGAKTKSLFTRLGYTPSQAFNALHGYQRLLFWDTPHERQVDIFIDRMQMCHNLDFRARLQTDSRTLSLADLLLTKLQIVEVNEKDLVDTMALFLDHEVLENDKGMNASYIARLTSADWGLYKTLTLNLAKLRAFAVEKAFPDQIPTRIEALLSAIETQPKSLSWKTRALVGERVRWYELPEEPR
ncbi:MAG TPA: hypothetical protein VGM01_03005 [Ktedonobacteraceae bacterium]|jgi:hypothetical protein